MIKKKELFQNLLLLFFVLLFFFFSFELVLRVLDIGTLEKETVDIIKHEGFSPFLVFGPNWNKEIEFPNGKIATWNSQGFRRSEDVDLKKEEGSIRIVALGGSTTENLANTENLHYSGVAEELFQLHSSQKIEVLNGAKSAYSSAHTLIRLQFDILEYSPDIVTVMHNINDLTVNFFEQKRQNDYANKYLISPYYEKVSFERELLKKSNSIVFFYKKIQELKQNLFYEKVPLTEEGSFMHSNAKFTDNQITLYAEGSFRKNLRSIIQIAKANNITLVLMSQPAVFSEEKIALSLNFQPYNSVVTYPKREQYEDLFKYYNSVIEEIANSEEVYFIDMYELFGQDEENFVDMVHYSPKGVKLFGRIYAEELEKIMQKEKLSLN